VQAHEQVVFADRERLADLGCRAVFDQAQAYGIAQAIGQLLDAVERVAQALALLGAFFRPGVRAGLRKRRVVVVRAVVERVHHWAAPHDVDDLVLQHRRQPRAQLGAAGKGGAAGDHGLEDVVHRVFGQHRVGQPALGKAHEVAAVRSQVACSDGEGSGQGRGEAGLHGEQLRG